MARLVCVLVLSCLAATQACNVGDWGEWTEWTQLGCGEEPSGAELPTRGKHEQHKVHNTNLDPEVQQEGRVACNQGFAGNWPCLNIDQVASFTFDDLCGDGDCPDPQRNMVGKDVVGWRGPDELEYAIMLHNFGASFVRITEDQFNVSTVDAEVIAYMRGANNGDDADQRDAVVIGNFLFVTANSSDHGLQVLDLTPLVDINPGFTTPLAMLTPNTTYNGFGKGLNLIESGDPNTLFVAGAEGGVLTCDGGLLALDVTDPLNINFAGCYGDSGKIYDGSCIIYDGRDDDYLSNVTSYETCFLFNGIRMLIVDATDRQNMQLISTNDYVGRGFASQGCVERRHIMMIGSDSQDELNNAQDQRTRTYIWDIVDLDAPFRDFTYTAEYTAIDSKNICDGDRVYQAHYEAGLRISQVDQTLERIQELGYFDMFLDDPQDQTVEMAGLVGVYTGFVGPLNNGRILCASIEEGLFILAADILQMNQMVEDGTVASERYRYREILDAEDLSLCPGTVDVETRYVNMAC